MEASQKAITQRIICCYRNGLILSHLFSLTKVPNILLLILLLTKHHKVYVLLVGLKEFMLYAGFSQAQIPLKKEIINRLFNH